MTSAPRVLNLTPHAVHVFYPSGAIVTISSSGELRLLARARSSVPISPLHYVDVAANEEAGIPLIEAQVFTGLDTSSPGYALLADLKGGDAVIVSMPVAHHLATLKPAYRVLSPGTGSGTVVRDQEGKILGVRALEIHA